MDLEKNGKLIARLRKEAGLTQKQLADKMHISDRAVSKWERGLGCPDVSLLGRLSEIFSVNIEKLLAGDLYEDSVPGGNMKRIEFYSCPVCSNILISTGRAELSCCGRKLTPLIPAVLDETLRPDIKAIENDIYVVFDHPMTKDEYISFVANVGYDRYTFVRLYPEQGAEVRLPQVPGGKIYFATNGGKLYYLDN